MGVLRNSSAKTERKRLLSSQWFPPRASRLHAHPHSEPTLSVFCLLQLFYGACLGCQSFSDLPCPGSFYFLSELLFPPLTMLFSSYILLTILLHDKTQSQVNFFPNKCSSLHHGLGSRLNNKKKGSLVPESISLLLDYGCNVSCLMLLEPWLPPKDGLDVPSTHEPCNLSQQWCK